jgi:guanosine-3',5'-bis(diphosphate) 3'-pyrophosphohydrolase
MMYWMITKNGLLKNIMSELTDKALTFATKAHASINQKRKYTGEDYIVHPIAVAAIVASVTDDEELIAAAYLHDVLEDVAPHKPEFGLFTIKKEFGSSVATAVHQLTNLYTKENYPHLNRARRKELENKRIGGSMDYNVMTVKLADIIHNCSDLSKAGDFAETYKREKLEQLDYLHRGDKTLWCRAHELLKKPVRKRFPWEDAGWNPNVDPSY